MSSHSNTPQKAKPGATRSSSHFSMSKKSLKELRDDAAELQKNHNLVECARITECARPTKRIVSSAAQKLSIDIHNTLEDVLYSDDSGMEDTGSSHSAWNELPLKEKEAVQAFRSWILGKLKKDNKLELAISKAYSAFVRFIAYRVEAVMKHSNGRSAVPKRVILPCNRDLKPSDSDEDIRIDTIFVTRTNTLEAESLERVEYRAAFALTEIKISSQLLNDAYKQLLRYTRQVYAAQHNRRFAWGFALCGTVAKVVLFTHDLAIASDSMDLADSYGRKDFIKLLVDFSYCEEDRLGYDPTITWDTQLNCWVIECPRFDDITGKTKNPMVYYARDPEIPADRLFGRHTRGFLASLDYKKVDMPDTFIKDSWPYSSRDTEHDSRDEVAMVREIGDMFGQQDSGDLIYVNTSHGGIIQCRCNSTLVNDNTEVILGDTIDSIAAAVRNRELDTLLEENEEEGAAEKKTYELVFFRMHKRIATVPVGQPLTTLTSPYELMIVLADVMRTHVNILEKCNILHRDLSTNNILCVRSDKTRPVRGLLIDFDCAIRVGEERVRRPERTGTPPFMSISNLMKSDVERSELDDWESVLYIVCWLGVHGVSEEDREARAERIKAHPRELCAVEKWGYGEFSDVAALKQRDLGSKIRFEKGILKHFIPGDAYEELKDLARKMHMIMFFNPLLEESCHGTMPRYALTSRLSAAEQMDILQSGKAGKANDSITDTEIDPFERRYHQKREISKHLLGLMENIAIHSKEFL
ncbi:hypothetical protein COEREDRAFT_13862 [Coemansia reversa NRRL 1564]|uniref:Fungal-type protein kinase domain-containing protein n=1 Tax=Coemansia reversa (strain ATCC 12441 / NRRL 1564) TaxID=763665 RepID=A0A2G5BH02_COERN|nr:hypothetical protein COEREDRAFT_13862 [Coemansia reversa NRRL 1564]|eukprot:PIA18300.1 hypothetical protein COEREDRAFT_13862 [Coemansia reversa NRRL 1564]